MAHRPGPADLLATEATLLAISLATIAARFNLRLRIQRRRVMLGDGLIVFAWLNAASLFLCDILVSRRGIYDPDIHWAMDNFIASDAVIVWILKVFIVENVLNTNTLYGCKAALLVSYLQIFPEYMKKRRIFLWATIVYTAAAFCITHILSICICLPIDRQWSLDSNTACSGSLYFLNYNVNWALQLAGDVFVFVLPWFIMPALNLKGSIKIGVYFTFLLGFSNITFCIVRWTMVHAANQDDSVSMTLVGLWGITDSFIGVFIACLPSLGPYFGEKRRKVTFSASDERMMSEATSTQQHPGLSDDMHAIEEIKDEK